MLAVILWCQPLSRHPDQELRGEFPPIPPRPAPNPPEGRFMGMDGGGPTRTEPRTERPASGKASRNVIRRLKATVHGPNPFEDGP